MTPTEHREGWRTILWFSDRYLSTTLTAEHVRDNTFPTWLLAGPLGAGCGVDRPMPVEQESTFVELGSEHTMRAQESRHAHAALAGVPDLVVDVEDRIEVLLQQP